MPSSKMSAMLPQQEAREVYAYSYLKSLYPITKTDELMKLKKVYKEQNCLVINDLQASKAEKLQHEGQSELERTLSKSSLGMLHHSFMMQKSVKAKV